MNYKPMPSSLDIDRANAEFGEANALFHERLHQWILGHDKTMGHVVKLVSIDDDHLGCAICQRNGVYADNHHYPQRSE
jgi:hypothetical protein